jgi:glycosyltransferase involved in cell wall biosynthesis
MSEPAEQPLISVCTPTYKRPDMLRRAVESVRAQTYGNWEMVISDDEVPAGPAWDYLQALAREDPRVTVLRNESGPHGHVGNMNNAMRRARGAWIKPLDDDDALRPECLATFVEALKGRGNGTAMAVCMSHLYEGSTLVRTDPRGVRPRLELIPRRDAVLSLYLQDVDFVPTQVLVNRVVLDRGDYFAGAEGLVSAFDTWWFARIAQHGDLLFVNEPLVDKYHGHVRMFGSHGPQVVLDREFHVLRQLMRPMIDPQATPPSLTVVNQQLRLIRSMHRLYVRQPVAALKLAAGAWHPQAWFLAIKWLLRRRNPGRFYAVPRVTIEA